MGGMDGWTNAMDGWMVGWLVGKTAHYTPGAIDFMRQEHFSHKQSHSIKFGRGSHNYLMLIVM